MRSCVMCIVSPLNNQSCVTTYPPTILVLFCRVFVIRFLNFFVYLRFVIGADIAHFAPDFLQDAITYNPLKGETELA